MGKDIEKLVGKQLGDAKGSGPVSSAETGSDWKGPQDWPQWLPHDWGISRKLVASSGKFTTIYVRPDYKRFQWHKAGYDDYVAGRGEGGVLNVDPSLLPEA